MMICWESKKNDKIVKSPGALPRNFLNYLTYWIPHLPVNLINKIDLKLDSPVWQFVIQMRASHLNNAPTNSNCLMLRKNNFSSKRHSLFIQCTAKLEQELSQLVHETWFVFIWPSSALNLATILTKEGKSRSSDEFVTLSSSNKTIHKLILVGHFWCLLRYPKRIYS